MKRLALLAFSASLALGACATQPTLYQPAAGPQAIGFSEYRIEPGRYRVTFRGGPGASAGYVTDLALRRAADLALQDGYDWFRVSDRFLQGQPDRGPRVSFGVGGGSMNFGRHSSTGVGLGVGTGFNLGGGPAVSATLEVMMGKGPRPPGADVYDARAIREYGAHT